MYLLKSITMKYGKINDNQYELVVDIAADNDKAEGQRSDTLRGGKVRETGNDDPLQEKNL